MIEQNYVSRGDPRSWNTLRLNFLKSICERVHFSKVTSNGLVTIINTVLFSEAATGGVLLEKVFLEISQNSEKTLVPEPLC